MKTKFSMLLKKYEPLKIIGCFDSSYAKDIDDKKYITKCSFFYVAMSYKIREDISI